MNYYIIIERAYDYDDCWMQRTESDGGTPITVHVREEDAENECMERNIEWLTENKENPLDRYIECLDREKLYTELYNLGFMTTKQYEEYCEGGEVNLKLYLLERPKKKQLVEICKRYDLYGYEVVEVPGVSL